MGAAEEKTGQRKELETPGWEGALWPGGREGLGSTRSPRDKRISVKVQWAGDPQEQTYGNKHKEAGAATPWTQGWASKRRGPSQRHLQDAHQIN